ncbi:MAG: hypothetical protein F4Z29_05560 [Gemmatimonadetes bacterium]|nr:hypothetical protein [Gemmatimonadota bacterium]
MKLRQRIETKIAGVKAELAKYAGLEEPDDAAKEKYKADLKVLETLNDQLAAAIAAEADGEAVTEPEDKEIDVLAGRVSMARYAQRAQSGSLDGAEKELNDALAIPHSAGQGVLVPWAIMDDGAQVEDRLALERYADAASATTADTRTSERSWTDRIFAGTVTDWLFGAPEMVPAGTASFPISLTGPEITGASTKNAAADATEFTFAANELKPERIGPGGIILNQTDMLRVPGLEAAARRDLRNALMDGIEAYCIGKVTDGVTAKTIKGETDAAITGQSTVGDLENAVLAAIDGKLALDTQGLRIASAPEVGTFFHGLVKVYSGSESEALSRRFSALGVSWRWSAHFKVITNQAGEFYMWIVRPVRIREAFRTVVWNAYSLIVDHYTRSNTDETAYRAVAHVAAKVIRSDSILRRRVAIT